ncbi:unnamed protein product [Polarella glacialis]|uniref:Pentatricopeptide repeat-containing protein n=1 Tax=Polarella glacialis TaxID=89957 RepID=A0A813JPV4_POLGL|nr:unnamed protein product [Polarella glacialis]
MPEARVVLDEITYSDAISACSKGGRWQLAMNLLSLMPEAMLVPDESTYSDAISACEMCGQLPRLSMDWQHPVLRLPLRPSVAFLPRTVR